MTALTMSAHPTQHTAPRSLPWHRMAWVTWRQHRGTLLSVTGLFAALAVFALIAGLRIHHEYAALTACHPFGSSRCQALNSSFNQADWTLANTFNILLHLGPALIGAFAGAPLLARELETGTYRYAWSQGYGRTRWTIAKLVLIAATVTAVAGAFSQLWAWFFQPFLKQEDMNMLTAMVFDTRGISYAAWTLAAFSLGVFFGMLIRRVVPAMAVTLGAYLGLMLLTWLVLRKHYVPASVTSNPNFDSGPIRPSDPWVLGTWHTGSTQWWRYIPVSRFWPMQFVEGGWLLAFSVLLIAATVWLVRHRAA